MIVALSDTHGREGGVPVLDPGSHAAPRQFRPAHAELDPGTGRGRLVDPDGAVLEEFALAGDP